MNYLINISSFLYLLPITFYLLPYTMYQLPVYPLDKRIVEIRLKERKEKKSVGLPAVLKCCGLFFMSYIQSVPGVQKDLGLGANPMTKMTGYNHMRITNSWKLGNTGNAIIINKLKRFQPLRKFRKSLVISKKAEVR